MKNVKETVQEKYETIAAQQNGKEASCCTSDCCGGSTAEVQDSSEESVQKNVKEIVQQKYGAIAERRDEAGSSCCGSDCCGEGIAEGQDFSIMADDYQALEGYQKIADLGLGCGLPTEFAKIKKGDVVVDLGAGAGNDCFVARAETGATGEVIGVDFTPSMVARAKENVAKLGFDNVRFVEGDIEAIPLPDQTADVVVSNCVFNLVPDKTKAFAETYRILKQGGHFSISDIVLEGELPVGLQKAAEMYVGCVAGAIQVEEYLDIVRKAGFQNITLQKKKAINLPASLLSEYLSAEDLAAFQEKERVYSVTVYAER